jgi:hypothetical protein
MFNNNNYVSYDSVNQPIIDQTKYNGRVNIIRPLNPNIRFQMQERIAVRNKSTSYCDALTGNWEDNLLSQVFFSKENIQIIQNGLRAGVYEMSKHKFVIPPQNIESLKIVMRSTYLQYAEHEITDITKQVERLNHLVLEYCIPSVYNEAIGYLKYCEDQSSLVVPIDLPVQNDRQFQQLEMKSWF